MKSKEREEEMKWLKHEWIKEREREEERKRIWAIFHHQQTYNWRMRNTYLFWCHWNGGQSQTTACWNPPNWYHLTFWKEPGIIFQNSKTIIADVWLPITMLISKWIQWKSLFVKEIGNKVKVVKVAESFVSLQKLKNSADLFWNIRTRIWPLWHLMSAHKIQ